MTDNGTTTLLIVEPESVHLESLKEIFVKDGGFMVTTAKSGKEAISIFRKNHHNIVITEFLMPEMTGLELLKVLKKLSPATEIIIMTAFGKLDIAVESMKLGAYDFIEKPTRVKTLLDCVKSAMEKQLHFREKYFSDQKAKHSPEIDESENLWGSRTFKIINGTFQGIRQAGLIVDLANLADFNDIDTYNLIGRGETDHVFLLDSKKMQEVLRVRKPSTFNELTALIQLHNEGPILDGIVEHYLQNRKCRDYEESLILWDKIETDCHYVFFKAFAYAYSMVSYRMAYLKTHYPEQFNQAVMANKKY